MVISRDFQETGSTLDTWIILYKILWYPILDSQYHFAKLAPIFSANFFPGENSGSVLFMPVALEDSGHSVFKGRGQFQADPSK